MGNEETCAILLHEEGEMIYRNVPCLCALYIGFFNLKIFLPWGDHLWWGTLPQKIHKSKSGMYNTHRDRRLFYVTFITSIRGRCLSVCLSVPLAGRGTRQTNKKGLQSIKTIRHL